LTIFAKKSGRQRYATREIFDFVPLLVAVAALAKIGLAEPAMKEQLVGHLVSIHVERDGQRIEPPSR
jgi:hypothetical protein